MNTIQKGGSISRSNNFSLQKLYDNVTNISPLNVNSIGGYLFRVTIQPSSELICLYPGKDKNNIFKEANSLLLKVCQIGDYNYKRNGKEIITLETFHNEIEIQREVHNKSFDLWCEPICPKIIYFIESLRSCHHSISFFNKYFNNWHAFFGFQQGVKDLGFFFYGRYWSRYDFKYVSWLA